MIINTPLYITISTNLPMNLRVEILVIKQNDPSALHMHAAKVHSLTQENLVFYYVVSTIRRH